MMDLLYITVGKLVVWGAVLYASSVLLILLANLLRHPICAAYLSYHVVKRECVRDDIRAGRLWLLRVFFILMFKNGAYCYREEFRPTKKAKNQMLLIIDFQKFIPRKIQ